MKEAQVILNRLLDKFENSTPVSMLCVSLLASCDYPKPARGCASA